jgi:autotransporter-associated beta strand protein
MRPRERRETGEQDLFRSRLDQIIDLTHALVKLSRAIDWRFLEVRFGLVYAGNIPTSLAFGPSSQAFYVADTFNLWSTVDQGTHIIASTLPTNFTRPTSVEFIDNNGVEALLVGGLSSVAYAQSPILVADSNPTGDLGSWRLFGSGLPNALVCQMSYNSVADVLAVASVGRGVWTLYDVTSYFPQATALQFGLADNDSMPDASYLTDGTHLDGATFVRPLNKYGTGTLTIAGNASYTGGTTIFGGVLQLGTGGTSGSILGDVSFCSDATDPLCNASTNKFIVFDRSDTYTFAGDISGPGQLVQTGIGTTVLTGVSTYTGPSIVDSGALEVNGSILSSVFVNPGATLAGTGTVGSTTINMTGTLLPGDGIGTVGTLKVAGDLLLMPGSSYLTTVARSTASSTSVAGVATLSGNELSLFEPGSLINSYTILSAAGGRTGTFDVFTAIGLPSFVSAALNYTATDVTLDLTLQIAGVDGLSRNERAVGGGLDDAFNSGGGIPEKLNAALFGLSEGELPAALNALSGEVHATMSSMLVDDSRYVRDAILGRLSQAGYGKAATQVGRPSRD